MAIILPDNTPIDVQTEFAVDMTCQNCVNAVQESLRDIQGIERYDIDLAQKRVTITGKTPPSRLLTALKSTQRQVIVRGASSAIPSSTPFPQSAAVSILESPLPLPSSIRTPFAALASSSTSPQPEIIHSRELPGLTEDEFTQKVFGICRFVQIAPKTILMDLTVRLPPSSAVGLHAGRAYEVYISRTGDMVDPPRTTGGALVNLGKIEPDKEGYGDMFREVEGELWEWVGRGCVVQATAMATATGAEKDKEEKSGVGKIFAGVVARSAGAWGNEKTVCACSGRTMWEEGREMQAKSAL